ncbi:hypothetical protein VTK73DRAFT_5130 [Phialemonium thermophilum]|uniref:Uncharacterized protein n=1 Tax=Phialemonium thermophilum TaxID=223376 RepID=A0ABR3V371_9PEZI
MSPVCVSIWRLTSFEHGQPTCSPLAPDSIAWLRTRAYVCVRVSARVRDSSIRAAEQVPLALFVAVPQHVPGTLATILIVVVMSSSSSPAGVAKKSAFSCEPCRKRKVGVPRSCSQRPVPASAGDAQAERNPASTSSTPRSPTPSAWRAASESSRTRSRPCRKNSPRSPASRLLLLILLLLLLLLLPPPPWLPGLRRGPRRTPRWTTPWPGAFPA